MSEVTIKSTKQQIFDALQEAERKLAAEQATKYDPMAETKKAEKTRREQSAAEIVSAGILSEKITGEYNDLLAVIEDKKKELKDLHGIEVNMNTLVATINANNEKKAALEADYTERKAELEQEYALKKTELEKEYDLIDERSEEEHQKKMKALENALEEKQLAVAERTEELERVYASRKAELDRQRQREEEEYKYNLKRERQKDADKWEDEKAAREKEIAEKEAKWTSLNEELDKKSDHVADLEANVASIPDLIAKAKAEAFEEGKKTAGKEYAFEKNALKKDAEHMQALLEARIESLTAELQTANAKVAELQNKVDNAYDRIQKIASDTVQSAGGVKILNSSESASQWTSKK